MENFKINVLGATRTNSIFYWSKDASSQAVSYDMGMRTNGVFLLSEASSGASMVFIVNFDQWGRKILLLTSAISSFFFEFRGDIPVMIRNAGYSNGNIYRIA